MKNHIYLKLYLKSYNNKKNTIILNNLLKEIKQKKRIQYIKYMTTFHFMELSNSIINIRFKENISNH